MNLTDAQLQELGEHLMLCDRLHSEVKVPDILGASDFNAAHSRVTEARQTLAKLDHAIFQLFHLLHTFNSQSHYTYNAFLTPRERQRQPTIDDL